MKLIKRILAAALVLAMALSLAGCGDTTWICKIDDSTVASGLYIYYQTEGYGDALYQLYLEDSDTYMMPYLYYYNYGYVDATILDATMSDGTTVEDYINQYALDMCKQQIIVDRLFDELGLTVDEDQQSMMENSMRNTWNDTKDTWEAVGVGEASFEAAVMEHYKEDQVFNAYYEVGGLNGTTEEELQKSYEDNYARVKYMTFNFADSIDDAIDEARKDEQLQLANDYLEMANSGDYEFDFLIDQYNSYLESIAEANSEDGADDAAADSETEEPAENSEDTEDTDEADASDETDADAEESEETEEEYPNESVLSKDSTYPSEKFVNYVFTTCPVGSCTVIQDDTNFYLVQRLDITERTDLYEDNRESIIRDLFDDDFTDLINKRLADSSVEVNDKSVKRYTVKKAFPEAAE